MKNKNVGYSEFLRAYKRNLVNHPQLVCYRYYSHFWFYTQKNVWIVDVSHELECALVAQINKVGSLQEEKDR